MSDASLALSYGSVDESRPSPLATPDSIRFDEQVWEWEKQGTIAALTREISMNAGKQFIALALILLEIYHSKKLLMSCDSRVVGDWIAVLCEYTKAYVRCFPLLATALSLIVASRLMLCQRIYYEMLKKRVILGFHRVSPLRDPLFLILLWCCCSACLHFVVEMCVNHPLSAGKLARLFRGSEKQMFADIREMAFLYALPSWVFMAFLWQAYDVELKLVPLSKYFEEDPEHARTILSRMQYIPESLAAHVLKKREIKFTKSDGTPLTADEVFTQFARLCKRYSNDDPSAGLDPSCSMSVFAPAFLRRPPEALEEFSSWHLISEMWPGRVLLDHRIDDPYSARFRKFWFCWCILCAATMTFVLVLLLNLVWKDIHDVRHGQYSDSAAVFVELVSAVLLIGIGFAFLKNAILPYLKALRPSLTYH